MIDEDYRGDVGVIVINLGLDTVRISHGSRIAQLVLEQISRATVLESDLEEIRGEGGFGSTGT